MKGARDVFKLNFLHVDIQLFQCWWLKVCLCSIKLALFLSEICGLHLCGSVSTCSVLFPRSNCLDYCRFKGTSEKVLKLGKVSLPTLFFINGLASLVLLPLHVNYRTCLLLSTK